MYWKKHANRLPVSDNRTPPATVETGSFDDKRRIELFVKDQIPKTVALGGYVVLAATSIGCLPLIIPQIKWYQIFVAYIFAPILAFCNAYGSGLTDWSLASTYGKLAIFVIGAWAGASHGGVLVGLAACGVMMSIVETASDLMQDLWLHQPGDRHCHWMCYCTMCLLVVLQVLRHWCEWWRLSSTLRHHVP